MIGTGYDQCDMGWWSQWIFSRLECEHSYVLSVKMKMIRKCGNLVLLIVLNILGKINFLLIYFSAIQSLIQIKLCGYFMEVLCQKIIFSQCSHFSNMGHQRYSATQSLNNTTFICLFDKFSIKDWISPRQNKQSNKRLMKWPWLRLTHPLLRVKSLRVMTRRISKVKWKPEESWSRKFVKRATKLGRYCLL